MLHDVLFHLLCMKTCLRVGDILTFLDRSRLPVSSNRKQALSPLMSGRALDPDEDGWYDSDEVIADFFSPHLFSPPPSPPPPSQSLLHQFRHDAFYLNVS